MFIKFIIILIIHYYNTICISNKKGKLYTLAHTPGYHYNKSLVKTMKTLPSKRKSSIIDSEIYKKRKFDTSILNYLIDTKESRIMLFKTHTQLLNNSNNLKSISIIASEFSNKLIESYSFYFFDLLTFFYLRHEIIEDLGSFILYYEEKLMEIFRILRASVIDASPKSRIKDIINLIHFRLIIKKLYHICKLFNIEHDFSTLENQIKLFDEDSLNSLAIWSSVHSLAFKIGVVMLSKAIIIALLNNLIIPILFNRISRILPYDLPGYKLITNFLKCLNISFN